MTRKTRTGAHKRPNAATHTRRAQEKFAGNDFAAAVRHCRLALKGDPDAADVWHLLAAALLAQHDLEAAQKAITTARELRPDVAEYHNTAALILDQCGRADAAEAAFRALLAAHPRHADGAYNLGRLLARLGRPLEAIPCLQLAIAARPDWNEAHKNLGHACYNARQPAAAEAAFMNALRLAPQDSETLINLGRLRQHDDDFDGATKFFQAGLAVHQDAASLLRLAMLQPIFCNDADDIAAHRARVEHNLALIENETIELDAPATMLGAPTFYFAYHGLNDKALMSRFGNIVERAWRPTALPVITRERARPRIAFVSAHFEHHAIGRLYAPLLEQLPRVDFEVAVLSIGHHDDAVAARINAAADTGIAVDADLEQARHALNELDADLVFFPDVGMEATSYWLAAERFAPVQALGWGHPVTSGLTTLDYFVSSRLLEPPQAASHYRETLVELPSWPVIYDDPGAPETELFARETFGFSHADRLYLCPQSLFKLHPDFDAYLGRILALDDAARVLLVGSNEAWRARLGRRFHAQLGTLAERIYFLPAQSIPAFYALIAGADVVLDTIHFAGGVTSFETIWAQTPFVTERGTYLRGRVTAGLADLLDLDTAVTSGADNYAERAVALAHDGAERRAFIATLAANKSRLLALGPGVSAAYASFFTSALNAAAPATRKLAS